VGAVVSGVWPEKRIFVSQHVVGPAPGCIGVPRGGVGCLMREKQGGGCAPPPPMHACSECGGGTGGREGVLAAPPRNLVPRASSWGRSSWGRGGFEERVRVGLN